ncbi:MAG: hypothetical protein MHM6MM_003246 [Cercozoa sp. M6MM]
MKFRDVQRLAANTKPGDLIPRGRIVDTAQHGRVVVQPPRGQHVRMPALVRPASGQLATLLGALREYVRRGGFYFNRADPRPQWRRLLMDLRLQTEHARVSSFEKYSATNLRMRMRRLLDAPSSARAPPTLGERKPLFRAPLSMRRRLRHLVHGYDAPSFVKTIAPKSRMRRFFARLRAPKALKHIKHRMDTARFRSKLAYRGSALARKVSASWKRFKQQRQKRLQPPQPTSYLLSPQKFHTSKWHDRNRRREMPTLTLATRVKFLFGDRAFAEMWRAVRVKELCMAARKGVDVRFVLDFLGSFPMLLQLMHRQTFVNLPFMRVHAFNAPSLQPMRLLPLRLPRFALNKFRRDHRKLLVVDRTVGFTGGMNLGGDYVGQRFGTARFCDMHMRIEGPAVQQLSDAFSESELMCEWLLDHPNDLAQMIRDRRSAGVKSSGSRTRFVQPHAHDRHKRAKNKRGRPQKRKRLRKRKRVKPEPEKSEVQKRLELLENDKGLFQYEPLREYDREELRRVNERIRQESVHRFNSPSVKPVVRVEGEKASQRTDLYRVRELVTQMQEEVALKGKYIRDKSGRLKVRPVVQPGVSSRRERRPPPAIRKTKKTLTPVQRKRRAAVHALLHRHMLRQRVRQLAMRLRRVRLLRANNKSQTYPLAMYRRMLDRSVVSRVAHIASKMPEKYWPKRVKETARMRSHKSRALPDPSVGLCGPSQDNVRLRGTREWAVLQVLRSNPVLRHGQIQRALLNSINNARHSIDIMSPYLFPPEPILDALKDAVSRGVRVRIMTSGDKCDEPLGRFAFVAYYSRILHECGAELYEYAARELHAKNLLIDGRLAMLGTFNLDALSFANAKELKVLTIEPHLCDRLQRFFDLELARCVRITSVDVERLESKWFGLHWWLRQRWLAFGLWWAIKLPARELRDDFGVEPSFDECAGVGNAKDGPLRREVSRSPNLMVPARSSSSNTGRPSIPHDMPSHGTPSDTRPAWLRRLHRRNELLFNLQPE